MNPFCKNAFKIKSPVVNTNKKPSCALYGVWIKNDKQ